MLQDNFRQKVQSNDGHLYLKVLKEEIAEELNLHEKSDGQDLTFDSLIPD